MNDTIITADIVTAAFALDWGSIVSRSGKIIAVPLGIEAGDDEILADHFGLCEAAESPERPAAIAAELYRAHLL